ncbi:hypothetical protein M569_15228, partial [Genlisea aurea]
MGYQRIVEIQKGWANWAGPLKHYGVDGTAMAAALECWSGRASTDEDTAEHVLMHSYDRSESPAPNVDSSSAGAAAANRDPSALHRRFQKLSRNMSEAISSLKNTLSLESPTNCRRNVWSGVVRSFTQLYPGGQLPEKLATNLRKHYDSMPFSYSQASFEMKDVVLHIKLIEQALVEDYPAIVIQELPDDNNADADGSIVKLTFACNTSISWEAMSEDLDSSSICCKKLQIFERKGLTLGVVMLSLQKGQERSFKIQIENALKLAAKKHKTSTTIKLSFGLCGCQDESPKLKEDYDVEEAGEIPNSEFQLETPLPQDSILVSVDEWQTVTTGEDDIRKWLLNQDLVEISDKTGPATFKGLYKGRKVGIEKIRGCEKGNAFEFQVRKDLLELMTCRHKNILPFHGVYLEERHGLCIVTKLMEGGSVHDRIVKNKKIQMKDIVRILIDIGEGIKFMNDHGVPYRELNTQRILLDKRGHACLGDMGIVSACKSAADIMDYDTDGYRWLAPEMISGDPENVSETWMSNSYSFGMMLWEMLSGETAYSAYSPVQAAVGITACGLRPDIPSNCPQVLKSLMGKCWNSCPSQRPQFSEILSTLTCFNDNLTSS